MARHSDLDPDMIDEIVALLRFYHSPECRTGEQIEAASQNLKDYQRDYPSDYARALRAYHARFAGRKERNGHNDNLR